MKKLLLFLLALQCIIVKAQDISVVLLSSVDKTPISNVEILIDSKYTYKTNDEGKFIWPNNLQKRNIKLSVFGYENIIIDTPYYNGLQILLTPLNYAIDEVIVSTGYFQKPKERLTGSYTHIDNNLLQRSIGGNILNKIEGLALSVNFDRRNTISNDDQPKIRVRGLSTIYGVKEEPLIILDDFPYDGDINLINPNDILDITILNDASASSIWGARAGNGVIVIKTKMGNRNNRNIISLNSELSYSNKPDFKYSSKYLSSEDYILFEKLLFDRGYYNSDEKNPSKPLLSPVVELLIKHRDGQVYDEDLDIILNKYKHIDVRDEIENYLYKQPLRINSNLNFSGGFDKYDYFFSINNLQDNSAVKGNITKNSSLYSNISFNPLKNVSLGLSLGFVNNTKSLKGIAYQNFKPSTKLQYPPYIQLFDENGIELPIPHTYRTQYVDLAEESNLMNWQYYPLTESNLNNIMNENDQFRFGLNFGLNVFRSLKINLLYNFQKTHHSQNTHYNKDSYYVRHRVNMFTQSDGQMPFPYGDILYKNYGKHLSQSGRFQIFYEKSFNAKHELNGLLGVELRQILEKKNGHQFIGYDPDVLTFNSIFDFTKNYPLNPTSSGRLPYQPNEMVDLTDRYVSYYGNLSYTYKDKYIFSGSSRWDASNIFGVKSNQKGVGLWSIGGSWVLDKETFYSSNIFSKVKLSSTFGFMGNIDSDASSFPTIAYSTNSLTGNQIATIRSPGNPNLRWEQVGMFNTSVDFSLIGNVLSGTIQFYHKNSTDLLGVMELDPTTGFTSNNYKMNYASLKTQGFDLELNSNIINNKSINWNSKVLFSYVSDKVTDYRSDGNGLLEIYLSMDNSHPVVGNSLYTLYSFPWHGLDKQTGDPLVKINNDLSKDYATYWNNIDPKKDLVVSGKKIPPFFGSFRNTLSIKKFQVSAMIVFRGGHVFRRNSINYNLLSNNWQGHEEYNLRWQNPGDELHTNVPSIPTQFNQNRDRIYNFSEVNVERGDVLRLHDVSIMYYGELKKKYLKEYRISFYVKDPMIIWKLNKEGIDPDFPLIDFRNRPLFSVGINLTL